MSTKTETAKPAGVANAELPDATYYPARQLDVYPRLTSSLDLRYNAKTAAQNITGSNLAQQIPLRGAGDELDHLIDTFNRMTERLHQSFEQIRRFSTDVSHELRTPITAIRGQLEVALFTARTTEQYREAVLNALQDIDRLSQIVRALLLLSQAESGQLVLQKAPVDLSEVVRDLVDQFQIPAEAEGVRLSADTIPHCFADADRVRRPPHVQFHQSARGQAR